SLIVRVEIAGMRDEDFRIALVDSALVIAGIRRDTLAKRGLQQMEINWGPFQTEVTIGMPIRDGEIEARYENGFLIVELPKAHPRRIPIQNRDEE
ncbi:MAG: Hsp20/alpha crystallin family protein, partial [Anaerolineae bacterium]|nr:Hsp20/alpha crystallin family protein [Anaerolineae bacterium]